MAFSKQIPPTPDIAQRRGYIQHGWSALIASLVSFTGHEEVFNATLEGFNGGDEDF